jgi:mRNA interferase MazF
LILSDDRFNRSAAELVIAVPITSKGKAVPSHVEVSPPEGGLTMRSFVKCEEIRAISTERLLRMIGTVNTSTLHSVEQRLRMLLNM